MHDAEIARGQQVTMSQLQKDIFTICIDVCKYAQIILELHCMCLLLVTMTHRRNV